MERWCRNQRRSGSGGCRQKSWVIGGRVSITSRQSFLCRLAPFALSRIRRQRLTPASGRRCHPKRLLQRRISPLPFAVLGLGLLLITGIIIQSIQFHRRDQEPTELALLDAGADTPSTRKNAASGSVAGVGAMAEVNACRPLECFGSDATGDREAVQLRLLNPRGETVALPFPIVRAAASFQP